MSRAVDSSADVAIATSAAPRGARRRTLSAAFAALFVGLLALVAPATAQAVQPAFVQVKAEARDSSLHVTAVLYGLDSRPIGGRTLTVQLNNGQQAHLTTGGDGYGSAQLAVAHPPADGRIEVRVGFAGDAEFGPAEGTAQAQVGTPAAAGEQPTQLQATAEASKLNPGDMMTITGRLTAAAGPVSSAQIATTIAGQPISLPVTTSADGRFTVQAQMPSETPPGQVQVRLDFAAAAGLGAASTMLTVNVVARPKPTPTPTPSPTPTPTPTPTSQAAATDAQASAPTDVIGGAPGHDAGGNNPFVQQLILGGVALAVAFAGLITVAWMAHRRHETPHRAGSRFIDDGPDAW